MTRRSNAAPVTSEEYRARQAKMMTEEELDDAIMEAAGRLGWTLDYHTYDSRKSDRGFPDRVLVSIPQKRVLWIEEKREGKELTPHQAAWIAALQECGQEAYVWTPSQWFDGTIERILRGFGEADERHGVPATRTNRRMT